MILPLLIFFSISKRIEGKKILPVRSAIVCKDRKKEHQISTYQNARKLFLFLNSSFGTTYWFAYQEQDENLI